MNGDRDARERPSFPCLRFIGSGDQTRASQMIDAAQCLVVEAASAESDYMHCRYRIVAPCESRYIWMGPINLLTPIGPIGKRFLWNRSEVVCMIIWDMDTGGDGAEQARRAYHGNGS